MGLFTWFKLGAIGAVVLAVIYVGIDYRLTKAKVATLKVQVEQQAKVIEWYEKAAKIDKETADVHREIQRAVEANDVDRINELYSRLRAHQRFSPHKTAPAPGP